VDASRRLSQLRWFCFRYVVVRRIIRTMATMSVNQAAAALGVGRDTIYRRVRAGQLSSHRDAHGRLRVDLDAGVSEHTSQDATQLQTMLDAERRINTALTTQVQQLTTQLTASVEAEHELRVLVLRLLPAPEQPQERKSHDGTFSQQPEERRSWWRLLFRGP
jgi:excisionase family DNA binding protein